MQATPALWLIILTLGVAALGISMFVAQMRNRDRSPAQKAYTEAATRDQYRTEENSR